jgi:hypothetical protein
VLGQETEQRVVAVREGPLLGDKAGIAGGSDVAALSSMKRMAAGCASGG